MIDRDSKLSISRPADLLKLSLGSLYYLPKPVLARDLDIMRTLLEAKGTPRKNCEPKLPV